MIEYDCYDDDFQIKDDDETVYDSDDSVCDDERDGLLPEEAESYQQEKKAAEKFYQDLIGEKGYRAAQKWKNPFEYQR